MNRRYDWSLGDSDSGQVLECNSSHTAAQKFISQIDHDAVRVYCQSDSVACTNFQSSPRYSATRLHRLTKEILFFSLYIIDM